MISSSDKFSINDFPEFDEEFLREVRSSSIEVRKFINNFSNPYLKSNLISDYEAISQYDLLKIINYNKKELNKNLENITLQTYLNLIQKYPLEYLNLTFHHYITMFTPGGRIFLLEDSLNELNLMIPHNQSFKNLSGNIAVEKLNKNLFF